MHEGYGVAGAADVVTSALMRPGERMDARWPWDFDGVGEGYLPWRALREA